MTQTDILDLALYMYQEGFFTMWLSNEGHKEIKYVGNLQVVD